MKKDFDVEHFVDNVRKKIRIGQVYEWYEAQLVLGLKEAMDKASLNQEQRQAVFDYVGVKPEEIAATVAEGYQANQEAYSSLYGDEEDSLRSSLDDES